MLAGLPTDRLFLIAGPCVLEDEGLNLRVAEHERASRPELPNRYEVVSSSGTCGNGPSGQRGALCANEARSHPGSWRRYWGTRWRARARTFDRTTTATTTAKITTMATQRYHAVSSQSVNAFMKWSKGVVTRSP